MHVSGACGANGRETGTSCYQDCGQCGNDVCEADEAKRGSCCHDCGCAAGATCQNATCSPQLGNANADQSVDMRDVAAISKAARSQRSQSEADVDCDGKVSEQDASLLRQHLESRASLPCRTVTALSAGSRHTCALLGSGHVRCFGGNESGQLGTAAAGPVSAEQSVLLRLPAAVTAIAAGAAHSCALLEDGSVRCWGRGDSGQLGYGDAQDRKDAASVPAVALGDDAVAIAAGGDHTCALLKHGKVRCWGDNRRGQLGLGNTESVGDDEIPTAVPALALNGEPRALALGLEHTCVAFHDGALRCFGGNALGQLGLGHRRSIGDDEPLTDEATLVPLPEPSVAVSAGAINTCAILRSGKARCWGDNRQGQLGYAGIDSLGADSPVSGGKDVPLPSAASALVAGTARQCALLQDGRVACWGRGRNEVALIGLRGPTRLLTSGANHTCALAAGGALQCWGQNDKGQLGFAASEGFQPRAGALEQNPKVVSLFGTNGPRTRAVGKVN